MVDEASSGSRRHMLSCRLVSAAILIGILVVGALLAIIALDSGKENGKGLTPTPDIVRVPTDSTRPSAALSTPTETISPTFIPSPHSTANPAFLLAEEGLEKNAAWTPYIELFDGVAMALVPTGCFRMGSVGVYSNETPVHTLCFDTPYWIDVLEVTNRQYAASGYFLGDDLPRETVSWFEAAASCGSRGARLPTETEWEYAARGPDGLLYPWGMRFEEEYIVFRTNSDGRTHTVGSKPSNASWVGALDMSGNVSEWVSSLYKLYPYDAADGREGDGTTDNVNARVIRGGSWWTVYPLDLRTMTRTGSIPTNVSNLVGLRCVRSYEK